MSKLREFRRQMGLTQKQVAEKLDISESYYCQIENNKRRMSLQTALNISAILRLTPNDIFLLNNFAECQDVECDPCLMSNAKSLSSAQQLK